MRSAYEFDLERANLYDLTRLDAMQQDIVKQIVFFQFSIGEASREMRGINGDVEFFQDVRQRPKVILVPMREDDGGDVVPVLFQKIEVRDANVNAVNTLFRKTHPGVNDDHLVVIPHSHTIHPKLADSAERDEF